MLKTNSNKLEEEPENQGICENSVIRGSNKTREGGIGRKSKKEREN